MKPLLPNKVRGVARVDDRRVISGIIHVVKSGGRWVDAPACYGPRKTLYNRFVRWAEKGIWQELFRSEEHTSELQSLMRISYAVFCLKNKTHQSTQYTSSY